MSLVVVGSVAYDGLETPHGKVDRILGGSCTYISLAASFFTRVRIVAVVGDDFAESDAALLSGRGIDLEGLERVPGKTFFWAGVYSPDMNDRTTLVTSTQRKYCSSGYEKLGPRSTRCPLTKSWAVCAAARKTVARRSEPAGSSISLRT